MAITHAKKSVPYLAEFDKIINDIHNFYQQRGHKRIASLRSLAEELDENTQTLNYIYAVRWCSSELLAIKKIHKMCFIIQKNLEDISKDFRKFDSKTRETANKLLLIFRNKNFISLFHFMIDLLEDLNRYSQIFQESGGLVIGKRLIVNKMIESIKKLHTSFGSVFNNFLKDIVCEDESCTQCNCDLESYESHQVFWRNIELTDDLNVPKLTSFRKELLDQLEKEILKYFPDIDLKNFDIFLPEKFPRNQLQVDLFAGIQLVFSEISGYGKQEIAI